MKTKLFILTVCVALLSLGASAKIKTGQALTGNSLTEFGNYSITVADAPMMINNEAVKTYNLMYDKTSNPVKIGVVKADDCSKFIVRTDEFEVQYTCNKGVFGVKKIEAQYQQLAAVSRCLMHHYPDITPERIVGHSDIAPGRKTDPGTGFDWALYRAMLRD